VATKPDADAPPPMSSPTPKPSIAKSTILCWLLTTEPATPTDHNERIAPEAPHQHNRSHPQVGQVGDATTHPRSIHKWGFP